MRSIGEAGLNASMPYLGAAYCDARGRDDCRPYLEFTKGLASGCFEVAKGLARIQLASATLPVLSQILLKFECGDRLDTITLRAQQIAETR
jgi:hypothetical protein